MQIVKMQAVADRGGGPMTTLAHFSVAVTDAMRLHGLVLQRRRDGSHRFVVPNTGGTNVASFKPELAWAITAAAVAEYEKGPAAHVSA